MPAVVKIYRLTGTDGSTGSDITSINTRANTKDQHSTNDVQYPIQIPASGYNYSYWVTTRLRCDTSPSGTINNIRVFSDGTNSFGSGVDCICGRATTYRQATGTEGVTGTELTRANHSGLVSDPVSLFTYTSTSPLALNGSISNPSTGYFGDFFVYQVRVGPTASPGVTPAETITWRYDET